MPASGAERLIVYALTGDHSRRAAWRGRLRSVPRRRGRSRLWPMLAGGATRSRALARITPSQRRVDMALSRLERVGSPPLSLSLAAGWWQRLRLALIAWWPLHGLTASSPPARVHAQARSSRYAQRITGRRSSMCLADGLARAIHDAHATTPGLSAAVRPHRQEVLAARAVLGTLECRLRGAEPVTARGVALLRALLTDGTSPLYRPGEPGALGSPAPRRCSCTRTRGRCDRPRGTLDGGHSL